MAPMMKYDVGQSQQVRKGPASWYAIHVAAFQTGDTGPANSEFCSAGKQLRMQIGSPAAETAAVQVITALTIISLFSGTSSARAMVADLLSDDYRPVRFAMRERRHVICVNYANHHLHSQPRDVGVDLRFVRVRNRPLSVIGRVGMLHSAGSELAHEEIDDDTPSIRRLVRATDPKSVQLE